MKKHTTILASSFIILSLALSNSTHASQLSLTEAVKKGIANNSSYKAAGQQREAAAFGVDEAFSDFLPQVQVTGSIGRERATDRSLRLQQTANRNLLRQEVGTVVQQLLFDGFAASSRVAAAKAREAQTIAQENSAREQLVQDIADAYQQAALNDYFLGLAKEYTLEHEKILKLLTERFDAGVARLSEVTLAKVRLARFRSIVEELTNSRRQSLITLEQLIGEPVTSVEQGRIITVLPEPDRTVLWEQILNKNADFKAAAAALEAAQERTREARAAYSPTITANGEIDYTDGVQGVDTYGVQQRAMLRFRWQPFDGLRREARIDGSKADVRRVQYLKTDVEQQLRREFDAAFSLSDSSVLQIAQLEVAVREAQKTVAIYKEQYLAAQHSLLDVLDLTQEIFILQRQLATARYATTLSALRIRTLQSDISEVFLDDAEVTVEGYAAAKPIQSQQPKKSHSPQ